MTDRLEAVTRREFLTASLVTPMVLRAGEGAAAEPQPTVAEYIHLRLKEHGATTLFGVPGATCDPFFAAAQSAGVDVVVTSSDLEAGYAADGFARVRGLGAVSVTAGVGTLSLVAPIAGAFVERSPVVIVNGGPTPEDLRLQNDFGALFSHSTGKERSDLVIFREVTAFAERIESAAKAPAIIDAAITTALVQQRPVYLEVPKQLWEAQCAAPTTKLDLTRASSGAEPRLAGEVLDKLRTASRPVVLLGIEVQRLGLADAVTALVQKLGIPWATTLLSKAVIDERTPGFAGVYGGERAVPAVKQLVEGADALFTIGCVYGRQHRRIATQRLEGLISASSAGVRVGKRKNEKADLGAFVSALSKSEWDANPKHLAGRVIEGHSFAQRRASVVKAPASIEKGLTYDEVLEAVSGALDESCIAITDTSLSMYPAAELEVRGKQAFMSNSVWQAIGFSVAAAVGVGLAQQRRPVVVCGDGGFQMTAQALSTLARRNVPAIIVVLDNGQYGIEQWLLDARYFQNGAPLKPYLALNAWNYVGLANALGIKAAATADTPGRLNELLTTARASKAPSFIHALMKPHDLPAVLRSTT